MSSAFSVGKKYGFFGGTAIMAVVGGTSSKLTGGKFGNGALSAAYVHMFNALGDDNETDKEEFRELTAEEEAALLTNISDTRSIEDFIASDPPLKDGTLEIMSFFGLFKIFKSGAEIVIGKNLRVALLGNRTGNKFGRWFHYHSARFKPNGVIKHGQGMKRHRPFETKPSDKSFWDRF